MRVGRTQFKSIEQGENGWNAGTVCISLKEGVKAPVGLGYIVLKLAAPLMAELLMGYFELWQFFR
jgi:hypothetical protein